MEDLIKALQIFAQYGNPENPTNCSRYELAIMYIDPKQVSDAHIAELDKLGFFINTDEYYFMSFRFGSA